MSGGHGQGCACPTGAVGEFLLSQGLQQVDSKVLAAGEALHTMWRCQVEEKAESARREQEARYEAMVNNKLEELRCQIGSASSAMSEGAAKVSSEAELFRGIVTELLRQRDSETRTEITKITEVVNTTQASSLEVVQAEIRESKEVLVEMQAKAEASEAREAALKQQQAAELDQLRAQAAAEREAAVAAVTQELSCVQARYAETAEKAQAMEKHSGALLQEMERERALLGEELSAVKEAHQAALAANEAGKKVTQETHAQLALDVETLRQAQVSVCAARDDEINDLKIRLKVAEDQAREKFAEAEKGQKENALLDERLNHMETRLQEMAGQLNKAADSILAKDREVAMTKEMTTHLESTNQEYHDRAMAAEKDAEVLRTTVANLKAQAREAAELREKEETSAAIVQKQQHEASAAQSTIGALQGELKNMSARVREADDAAAALKVQLGAEQAQVSALRAEAAQQAEALAAAQAAGVKAQAQAAVLEREHAAALKAEVARVTMEAATAAGESQEKLQEMAKGMNEVTEALRLCKMSNDELLPMEEENKSLRVDLRAVVEERDELKELLAIGRYDAMDSLLRTARPVVTPEEAKQLRREADECQRFKKLLTRALDYLHITAIQSQDVLSGFLTCLPNVPPKDGVGYVELEEVHNHLTALLRDTCRAHIESKKREEKIADTAQPEQTGGVGGGSGGGSGGTPTLSALGATPIPHASTTMMSQTQASVANTSFAGRSREAMEKKVANDVARLISSVGVKRATTPAQSSALQSSTVQSSTTVQASRHETESNQIRFAGRYSVPLVRGARK